MRKRDIIWQLDLFCNEVLIKGVQHCSIPLLSYRPVNYLYSNMFRMPSPCDASRSSTVPYIHIFSSYQFVTIILIHRRLIAPPATSPWQFVEGFAQNVSRNPAQATVPGAAGWLDVRRSPSPWNDSSILTCEPKCKVTTSCLLKILALATDCLTDATNKS